MHWYHVVVAFWLVLLFTMHFKIPAFAFVIGLTLAVIGALHVGGFW